MLKCVDEYCYKWRCAANVKKSGIMVGSWYDVKKEEEESVLGRGGGRGGLFMLIGEMVLFVSKYKYLGVWLTKDW